MAKNRNLEGMIVKVERNSKYYCDGKRLTVEIRPEIPVGSLYLVNTGKTNRMQVKRANTPGITNKHMIVDGS